MIRIAYTAAIVWEAIFLLVILKIPVVYLGLVIWWAIRATPVPPEGLEPAPVPVHDPRSPGPSRWRGSPGPRSRRGGPHSSPRRAHARRAATAFARGRLAR